MKGASKDVARYLNEFQFRVEVSGAVEAILYSNKKVLSKRHKNGYLIVLMVDFSNVFNMVDRSSLLNDVTVKCLFIYLWIEIKYFIKYNIKE